MLKTGLVGVNTIRVQSRHSCMMILLAMVTMVMFLHPVIWAVLPTGPVKMVELVHLVMRMKSSQVVRRGDARAPWHLRECQSSWPGSASPTCSRLSCSSCQGYGQWWPSWPYCWGGCPPWSRQASCDTRQNPMKDQQ